VQVVTVCQPLRQFEQRQLALPADDSIHEIRFKRLLRNQRGVPAAKHNRQPGAKQPDLFRHPDCGTDHRAGEDRYAQAERVFGLAQDHIFEVR